MTEKDSMEISLISFTSETVDLLKVQTEGKEKKLVKSDSCINRNSAIIAHL